MQGPERELQGACIERELMDATLWMEYILVLNDNEWEAGQFGGGSAPCVRGGEHKRGRVTFNK